MAFGSLSDHFGVVVTLRATSDPSSRSSPHRRQSPQFQEEIATPLGVVTSIDVLLFWAVEPGSLALTD
jgi:hypothetical protein